MTRARLPLLMCAATMIALPACGSAAPAGATSPEKTADQIYSDYVTALRSARSMHAHGTVTYSDGTTVQVDLVATQDSAHAVVRLGSQRVEDVVTGGRAYERGGSGGPGWTVVTGDQARGLASLTLRQTALCAQREHGSLRKAGTTRIGGRPVAVIADDGHAPGASPGRGYVALDGRAYTLRAVQTGPETPGGSVDCGHTSDLISVSATIDYDGFDQPVSITPPPDVGDNSLPLV